jgi:hypothetical protein
MLLTAGDVAMPCIKKKCQMKMRRVYCTSEKNKTGYAD